MRSLDESSKRWTALFSDITSLSELRASVKVSNGDGPCIAGLRSVCWKSFLLFANFDTPTWSRTLEDSRAAYSTLRKHFLRNLEHPEELDSNVDPLTEDETSPWNTLRQDEALRAEILQDVERCMPENLYFRQPATQKMLLDVLFVFCKLNQDVSYRQGMHELLAPILWVVERDAINLDTVDEHQQLSDSEKLLKEILDAKFIEHDSFTLFSLVMQTAKSLYELDSHEPAVGVSSSSTGTSSPRRNSPIVEKSKHIHENYLAKVDPQLASRLRELDVLPQVFLIRWIRLLFGREFPFDELLALWDSLFAEDPALSLVELICVSMLLRVRWQLMEADYSTALTLLLRYPPPEHPHGPPTLVEDALFLKTHLTCAGGAAIIYKYSGKAPILQQSGYDSFPDDQGRGSRSHSSKSHQQKRSVQIMSPLISPARFIQQQGGLEAIIQDAARGVYDRGERWGVNKAVRDAVDEVKKNVQVLQQSSANPARRRSIQASSRWSMDEGRSAQTTKTPDFEAAIKILEKRNKTLAGILEDATQGLLTQQKELVAAKPEANNVVEAFSIAIAKVQLVKAFLEDPDLLVTETQGLENIAPTKAEKQPISAHIQPTQTPTASLQIAQSPSPTATGTPTEPPPPLRCTPATSSRCTSQQVTPHAQEAITPSKHQPSPFYQPRSSLAQSSFAWMLGDDESRPVSTGFVVSPPSSASKSHISPNIAKAGFLFGDGSGDDSSGSRALSPSCTSTAAAAKSRRKGDIVRIDADEGFILGSLSSDGKGGD